MTLSRDETRALSFIGLIISLSVLARAIDRPVPIDTGAGAADLAGLEAASREAMGRAEGPQPLVAGEKVDPNTASAAELARLPRGRGLAERIVADREANGPYRGIRDLDRVTGVGPATLEAWRDLLTLPWEPPGGVVAAATGSPGVAGDARVDLNRATAGELEAVPGIGPALAERIVAWRARNGRFRSLDDLVEVRGIGPATLERLRPHLKLGA